MGIFRSGTKSTSGVGDLTTAGSNAQALYGDRVTLRILEDIVCKSDLAARLTTVLLFLNHGSPPLRRVEIELRDTAALHDALNIFIEQLRARDFELNIGYASAVPGNQLWMTLPDFGATSILIQSNAVEALRRNENRKTETLAHVPQPSHAREASTPSL